MGHPRLPESPTLGTLTGDVDEYYSEQAKNDNQLVLKHWGKEKMRSLWGNGKGMSTGTR